MRPSKHRCLNSSLARLGGHKNGEALYILHQVLFSLCSSWPFALFSFSPWEGLIFLGQENHTLSPETFLGVRHAFLPQTRDARLRMSAGEAKRTKAAQVLACVAGGIVY